MIAYYGTYYMNAYFKYLARNPFTNSYTTILNVRDN